MVNYQFGNSCNQVIKNIINISTQTKIKGPCNGVNTLANKLEINMLEM